MENLGEEEKPKKHRARRKKDDTPSPAKGLLDALAFIKPAGKKKGVHCLISNHWMVAADGILTIATPIQEDLGACPQIDKFEEVLKQVGEDMSITQLSEAEISVSSGGMKAVVPCMAQAPVITGPDPQGGVINDNVKKALKELNPIISEKAEYAPFAGVLLNGKVAVGTNGHVLLEVEHGCNLPENVLVPKVAVAAVAKCKKTLSGFGYTGPSCTFYFEDGSFIKTQLFNEDYPAWKEVLDAEPPCMAFPADKRFFEAVELIGKMTEEGYVYFKDSHVCADIEGGSAVEIPMNIERVIRIDSKYIKSLKASMQDVVFDTPNNRFYFFTQNWCRGLIMGVVEESEV